MIINIRSAMFNKIIVGIFAFFLLTGCTDGFRNYLKKSANNKYIDTKGFKGGKRQPLYNKKYINLAKKNILEENVDDEDDEIEMVDDLYPMPSTTRTYRRIYTEMIKEDMRNQQAKKNNQKTKYPSLAAGKKKISEDNQDNSQVQQELAEIKALLNDAKQDLAKYKCPSPEVDNTKKRVEGKAKMSK